jgi:hypothetical protein
MLERTVAAQRLVCDGISNVLMEEDEGNVAKVKINEEMLKYCRGARMKYSNYLADKKTINMRSAVGIKKSNIKGDIGKEKSAKIKLENAIERLEKEANELAQKAEREKKMSLFIESNTIRKRSLEYKQELEGTVSKLRKLEDQLSKV